jgi:hypothetical protein
VNLIPEIREDVLIRNISRARERNIILPTFAQQRNPEDVPVQIAERLKGVGLWDLDPANLFRICWKNEAIEHGGGYGEGNWIEFPSELTGVDATIIGIAGKWFPTGAHKVGAAYGCLVPRLVSGNFDPARQKALPGAAPGQRKLRPGPAKGGLAFHRQLLQGRRIRLRTAGLPGGRDPA